jgi:dihydrofolate reductase
MLLWDTHLSMRDTELGAAFADVWCAIPRVVFTRTLDGDQGNAAEASVAEEAAAALDATDKDVSIGGAGLAAAAIELGLVDELRMCRKSGPRRWRRAPPFLPPVTEDVPLDLVETRTFGSRVIYERYRRARDESD